MVEWVKKLSKAPRTPMKMYQVGEPLERIAIDVMGSLKVTDLGNRHIMVIADYFSKWTESYPMLNQELCKGPHGQCGCSQPSRHAVKICTCFGHVT